MSKICLVFAYFFVLVHSAEHECLNAFKKLASENKSKFGRMFYSSGREFNDFGDIYECEKFEDTRFFVFILKLKFITGGIGICAPDACRVDDFQKSSDEFVKFLMEKYPESGKIMKEDSIEVVDIKEYDSRKLPWQAKATILIFSIIILLAILGTLTEIMCNNPIKPDKGFCRIFICFSLKSNFQKFLSLPKEFDNLHVLNGIRVLSMLFICYSHNYVYSLSAPTVNPTRILDMFKEFWSHLSYFPLYMVDMFFIISGFLVAFLVIKDLENKRGKYNWFMFLLHRLIRICPIYFLVLLFFINLMQYVGSGSMWPIFWTKYEEACENWWTNLLFISNLYPQDKHGCMGWSWFISNDMQFHIVSPIILLVHYQNKKRGYIVLASLILCNFLITSTQSYINDYNPGVIHGLIKDDQFVKSYQRPYNRIGPYLIGMFFGFVYRTHKDREELKKETNSSESIEMKSGTPITSSLLPSYSKTYKSSQAQVIKFELLLTSWVKFKPYRNLSLFFSSVLMLSYPFFTYNFDNEGPDYWPTPLKALYLGMEHIGFSIIFIIWLIPLTEGFGGWIFSFLSHPYFSIPAKISFSFYLVHPIIILLYVFNRPDSYFISHFNYIYTWPSTVLYSIIVSTLLTLLIESPILSLEKVLLRPTH